MGRFRVGRLLHFLTHGAPLARFARESAAKSYCRARVLNAQLSLIIIYASTEQHSGQIGGFLKDSAFNILHYGSNTRDN